MRIDKVQNVGNFLIVNSSNDTNVNINYILKNNITCLSFNEYDGYTSSDIKEYSDLDGIKKIMVVSSIIDLSQLSLFHNLEDLYCSNTFKKKFNFQSLPNLKTLNIEWNKNAINIDSLENLKQLTLRKYNGDSNLFRSLKKLNSLSLIQGNLNSLDFLEYNRNIVFLSLAYLKNLTDIQELEYLSSNLVELELETCKKVNYGNTLHNLFRLEKLKISNSSDLVDLSFIENLNNLSFFSFVDTKIIDGNLSILKRLDYVGFDNKRHYDHVNENGKAIPK